MCVREKSETERVSEGKFVYLFCMALVKTNEKENGYPLADIIKGYHNISITLYHKKKYKHYEILKKQQKMCNRDFIAL